MNCPKCQSNSIVKNGKFNNRQKLLCKNCHFQFILKKISNSLYKDDSYKRRALTLYLYAYSIRKTAALLEVSPMSVSNWLKQHGNTILQLKSENTLDECSYIEGQKYIVSKSVLKGYHLLLIDLETDVSFLLKS